MLFKYRYILLALLLILPAFIVAQPNAVPDSIGRPQMRVDEVMRLIDGNYVESPDMEQMSEVAINAMLKALDPHSVYIAARDVQRANEGLQGNFDGVGISFQIVDDTIIVTSVIEGGPSEKVGVMVGDRFLSIDGKPATGDSINNTFAYKHMRGKKGTEVVVVILREGKEYTFNIVRDKIPIYSIDTYFMINDSTGYVRLARFARSSVNEFRKAVETLKKQGMKGLVLDLRGNSGGYLDIACGLANEFLERNQLIVYTEGRTSNRQNFRANGHGNWRGEKGKDGQMVKNRVAVLIDESSASASEIVAGAIQDWDRGVLVGRRSFGKGLVQRVFPLKDGSQIRLTTARYYTPSGRCIQRPYDQGTDAYRNDAAIRYKHGELVNADSIHFADSLKFKTASGRIVYGGGGIMPDVFVPMDTMRLTDYFISLRGKGVLNSFPMHWVSAHRKDTRFASFDDFLVHYDQLKLDELLSAEAADKGIVRNEEKEAANPARTAHTDRYLRLMLKAQVARYLFGTDYYYKVMKDADEGLLRALEVIWQ